MYLEAVVCRLEASDEEFVYFISGSLLVRGDYLLKSEKLIYLEALVSRLEADDEEFISFQEAYYRVQAGMAGEEKMQRTLANYHFKNSFKIFYNFECINEKGFSHQIDALIITTRFLLVVEVKQISGTLFINPRFMNLPAKPRMGE